MDQSESTEERAPPSRNQPGPEPEPEPEPGPEPEPEPGPEPEPEPGPGPEPEPGPSCVSLTSDRSNHPIITFKVECAAERSVGAEPWPGIQAHTKLMDTGIHFSSAPSSPKDRISNESESRSSSSESDRRKDLIGSYRTLLEGRLEQQLERLEQGLEQRLERLQQGLEQRLERLEQGLEQRLEQGLEQRLERLEQRLEQLEEHLAADRAFQRRGSPASDSSCVSLKSNDSKDTGTDFKRRQHSAKKSEDDDGYTLLPSSAAERISMEEPNVSCPEELAGVKEDLKNNDTAAAAAKNKEYLEKQNNIPLNIAITGESGSGKSSFVNAFRGISDDDEGAAPTGVTETTTEPKEYPHPSFPNVKLWDLPGIGTTKFPAKKYLKLVEFEKFDFFIIISATRFRENDVKLAQEIQRMKKKFYFVRSKIDIDINGEKRKKNFSEEKTLTVIREDCIKRLRELGTESPQVFLVSSFDLQLYDFSKLQETLKRDLLSDTLLFVMPNISPEIIDKKKALQSKIKYYALGSAAAAAVPVPGLSINADIALLTAAVTRFVHVFGLDIPSLKRLSARTGVPYADLRAEIISPLAAVEISKELLMKVLVQTGRTASLIVAEEASRFIPLIGNPIAMGLSFATTYNILKVILSELAQDAQKVSEKVLV